MSQCMNFQPDVFQVFVCLTKNIVDCFVTFIVVSGVCCDMSYDCNIITILNIIVLLIEFVFSFFRIKFQSWTCKMAEARVGDHGCDTWTVFSDHSALKVSNMIA